MREISGSDRCGRVATKRASNKLDLYQLLCAVDYHSPPPNQCARRKPNEKHTSTSRPRDLSAPSSPTTSSSSVSSLPRSQPLQPPSQSQASSSSMAQPEQEPPLVWDWDVEHEDRRAEAKADAAVHGAMPFQVDRKLLKDIVHERMGAEVARIKFLGAGTFHKGYLVTLVDRREVVARVARRFMPRLKTESEVATMNYLRHYTAIPVPDVYHYDANPYNRLGGEYILMSKAPGIALSKVFHSLPHNKLIALMENIAMLVIPLFGHRFPMIGSLYSGPDPNAHPDLSSSLPTPTPSTYQRYTNIADAFDKLQVQQAEGSSTCETHVGPIISWPFFGSNRGVLSHPDELNRGPWRSTHDYLLSCVEREIKGVILENEGKAAPHRLHLDPDEIQTSRHHKVTALPDDRSDASDEWDWEESENEWEGPGDTMYQDYRRMQRTTFLVAHLAEREERVKAEMTRFLKMMERLGVVAHNEGDGGGGEPEPEEFSIDCHDLNLENVFVDENDNSKITCIIDWESTTTRPLWHCAHVPSFLQSSPFTAKLFRATVEKFTHAPPVETVSIRGKPVPLAELASSWLHYEATGARLRMAHRCIEWDGWEEGLVDSMIGPEEQEEDWFKEWRDDNAEPTSRGDLSDIDEEVALSSKPESPVASISPTLTACTSEGEDAVLRRKLGGANGNVNGNGAPVVPTVPKVVVAVEKEREKLLNATGDFCGGRGGELGRRLEAWLYVSGDEDGRVGLGQRWEGEGDEEDY
ncbi:hypothetical protein L226DRAFT_530838 [Lentinus tigrinus ALCF2SS1-7]|uniref:Uncharacterized protein n=1 Tax=Lentinus tigrinus ALCF2SS1-6 TaxID=1328759 RepID=A0A5C2SQ54_9APHY|nr:hypothetical protein L227DRAFT_570914 [Lentinus tigrinus ALCF2SS1-6]RPD78973.1 hypothetical protein L226DRAFT_530838 [Lentinus tigrinus ALCF2SS1-7]